MTHDEWRLLGYGMLTAFLMALVLVPILLHDRNFPRLAAEGILGAIALAVFLLSRYMGRRTKSKRRPARKAMGLLLALGASIHATGESKGSCPPAPSKP